MATSRPLPSFFSHSRSRSPLRLFACDLFLSQPHDLPRRCGLPRIECCCRRLPCIECHRCCLLGDLAVPSPTLVPRPCGPYLTPSKHNILQAFVIVQNILCLFKFLVRDNHHEHASDFSPRFQATHDVIGIDPTSSGLNFEPVFVLLSRLVFTISTGFLFLFSSIMESLPHQTLRKSPCSPSSCETDNRRVRFCLSLTTDDEKKEREKKANRDRQRQFHEWRRTQRDSDTVCQNASDFQDLCTPSLTYIPAHQLDGFGLVFG